MVVVEKGRYTKAEDLTTLEKDAYEQMYERGGLLMATEDGGLAGHPLFTPAGNKRLSLQGPS